MNSLKREHYPAMSDVTKCAVQEATTMLAKTYRCIGIEDLNVRGMVRNRRLSRAIMDGGFFEFRRQLEYKARFMARHW